MLTRNLPPNVLTFINQLLIQYLSDLYLSYNLKVNLVYKGDTPL